MRCPKCNFNLDTLARRQKEAQQVYPKAFTTWTPDDDRKLRELAEEGAALDVLSKALGRQPSAIKKRLELLTYRPSLISSSASSTT